MNNFETPHNKNENNEPIFTPELKVKLSELFMGFLNKNKTPNKDVMEMRKIVGGSEEYYESEEGLRIFRDSIYDLIADSNFPNGKTKITIKIMLENLNTFSLRNILEKTKSGNLSSYEISKLNDPIDNPINGLSSYTNAFNSVISTLEGVLTPEVNLAIRAYAEKIFIKPFKDAIDRKGF